MQRSRHWLGAILGTTIAISCGPSRTKSDAVFPGTPKADPVVSPLADPFADIDFAAPPSAGACPPETAARCEDTWNTIRELKVQRDTALTAQDKQALAKLALDLDKQLEILDLLRHGETDPAVFAALSSKYQQLAALLNGDVQRNLIYRQIEIAEVAKVTRDYGTLYINETPRVNGAPGFEELSVDRPWSGYWYPFRGKELFDGNSSPLGKLDRVLKSLGRPANTAASERASSSLPNADSWEGRCPAWSVASVSTREPPAPVSFRNAVFSIEDQKALMVLAHETYPTRSYGIRYLGDSSTDGAFQSLRPEAFHQLFVKELGEYRRPFIINEASGVEVWQQPLYRMRWSIVKDPTVDSAYRVTALPFVIKSRTVISEEPTNDRDRAAPLYEYRLYVDPLQSLNGRFRVIAGEWLGKSQETHPHYATIAADKGELASFNADVNKAMDVIKQIIGND